MSSGYSSLRLTTSQVRLPLIVGRVNSLTITAFDFIRFILLKYCVLGESTIIVTNVL